MAQLKTQLIAVTVPVAGIDTPAWADNSNVSLAKILVRSDPNGLYYFWEYDGAGNALWVGQTSIGVDGKTLTLAFQFDTDSLDYSTGIFTFQDGKANRWQTPTATQLQTQLLSTTVSGRASWVDNLDLNAARVVITQSVTMSDWDYTEYDPVTHALRWQETARSGAEPGVITYHSPYNGLPSDINTINVGTGVYTFALGRPNRWQTQTIDPTPPPPPPPSDYVINQTLDPNLASRSVKTHADGTAEVLSKLTSVLGTQNQIDVTVTEGQVQIGLAQNLTFNSLEVNGDGAIHGNLTVDSTVSGADVSASGSVTAPTVIATTEVTAPTVMATTSVTAPTITASGAVNAAYLVLQSYPDETQIPLTVPAGALVSVNNVVGTLRR